MKNEKLYWEHMLDLWARKEWIDGVDFFHKTDGSQKFTSRISDMRDKGVEIVHRKQGNHNEYKLVTPREQVVKLMKTRKSRKKMAA